MSRRGPAVVGAAALAVLVCLFAWEAGQAPPPVAGRPVAVPPAAPPRGPSPTATHAIAEAPAARAAVAARESFDPTSNWGVNSPPPRPGEVEICGFGTAGAGSPAATALQQHAGEGMDRAADRLFALMQRSPDPQARAAALLARDERDALADMARQTNDATIYAMAVQTCHRADNDARPASCAALSAGQMARLDPDNVVPWLFVAADDLQRNDAAAVAEALYRASLATQSRSREFAFADRALSAIPADWPPRDAMLASAKVLQIHAALTLPSYLAAVQYCARDRMHDANRQQTCERLARVLTQSGDTLIDYGIGRRLGEWAGWPADVVEQHNARFEAYRQTLTDGDTLASNLAVSTGCSALRRDVRLAFAHARRGELASLQAEVERSGLSDATMIEHYRASLQRSPPTPAASAPH